MKMYENVRNSDAKNIIQRATEHVVPSSRYDVRNSSPVDNFETTAGIRSEEGRKPGPAMVFWVAEPVPVL